MTELELIVDFHRNTNRQGPGSPEETIKALQFIEVAGNDHLKIADIGCGSGGQTITLAKNTKGHITAVDLFPDFLNELNLNSKKLGLDGRIKTVEKSMEELLFKKDELDIIWSEGAIYNIGFENGIKQWKNYLKKGGYIAVSELSWITNSRPNEIEKYWKNEYPEIDTAANKMRLLEENGYAPAGYFVLAQESWIENYYKRLEKKFSAYLEKHQHSTMAKKVVEDYKKEIKLYLKYKDYYGYGFYIAKKME